MPMVVPVKFSTQKQVNFIQDSFDEPWNKSKDEKSRGAMFALVEGIIPCGLGVTTKINSLALDRQSLTQMRAKDSTRILRLLPRKVPTQKEVNDTTDDHPNLVD